MTHWVIDATKLKVYGGRVETAQAWQGDAVKTLKAWELKQLKQAPGYHQRSRDETAMYSVKQLIGSTLSLRNNAQMGETLTGVKVMNKMIGFDMPVRQRANESHENDLGSLAMEWANNAILPLNVRESFSADPGTSPIFEGRELTIFVMKITNTCLIYAGFSLA